MVNKFIKISNYPEIYEMVQLAGQVDGDVTFRKGVYCIDGKSLMGVLSINCSTGATVEYPESAERTFGAFINKYWVQ